jgi:hypothetical protein
MDSSNARMWAFNNIVTIEDESSKTPPNKTNTIQAWSTKKLLVVLVQTHTSKMKH